MDQLAIDYSTARPAPDAIRQAGYVAVLRYVSGDPAGGKDLTSSEAAGLLAAGLGIGLVWETTGVDYVGGAVQGVTDATAANAEADALGFPADCPLFYAIDTSVADPSVVVPYFKGAQSVGKRPVRGYGSAAVIDELAAEGFAPGWQTEAWSGTTVSSNAALYQRVSPTIAIPGVTSGDYDEDVILDSAFPWWTSAPAPTPAPEVYVTSLVQFTVHFTADGNGNGWVDSPVSPDTKIVSVIPTNADPPEVGGYVKVPTFSGITANNVLVFECGQPNGTFGYYVWAAS